MTACACKCVIKNTHTQKKKEKKTLTHCILQCHWKESSREKATKYRLFPFSSSLPFLSQILESVKCWLKFSGKIFLSNRLEICARDEIWNSPNKLLT